MRIVWSPTADDDLLSIWDYLVKNAAIETADAQVRRIVGATERLSRLPRSGQAHNNLVKDIRSIVVAPYVVFYRLDDDVEIVRVLHGRRDIDAVFENES